MMSPEQIERLAALSDQGRLDPQSVLDDATAEDSPLHPLFEWDDETAAKEHRLQQARRVIRSVIYLVQKRESVIQAPRYVRDPARKDNEMGYTDLSKVAADPPAAWAIVREEIARALGLLRRAHRVALGAGVEDAVDTIGAVIRDLETLRENEDHRIAQTNAA